MKRKIIIGLGVLIALALLFSKQLYAQKLNVKTNTLHLNFTGNGLPNSSNLAQIKWINPQFEYVNSLENTVELLVEVSSARPIKSITLESFFGSKEDVLATKVYEIAPETTHYTIKQKLKLPDGGNGVELTVENIDGAFVSSVRTITVGKNAIENMLAMDRKDYALLFATDKYENWSDLVNPIDDAHSIAKELRERYNFEVEIVENPSLDEVWQKLREYNERQFKPQDQLMVFFAGHGHYDEAFGEGYVVARNSLNNDASNNSYISHNRLRGVINNIASEHILLVMDVCFGGTLDPSIAKSRGTKENDASNTELIARKLSHRTRKYLTSGGKEYVSDGIPGKHSPFAAKLIEALRTNGGDDRILTMAEIKVNLETLKQVPRFGSFGEDETLSDFIFIAK